MPNYRNGAGAALGDEIVLVGAVDAILPNDELVVDVGPISVRVPAKRVASSSPMTSQRRR